MRHNPSPAELETACQNLACRDPALARAYEEQGVPEWRKSEPSFQTLARIIAYQQLSTKAAGTIWGRVMDRHTDMTPGCILQDDEEGLRSCGLSRPKIRHLKSIAAAIEQNILNFDALHSMPMDEARTRLISVKGIGPWTAEIFLMNALGRLDAFPVADVGLMEAYRQLKGTQTRPDPKAFNLLAEDWRPWRGVAAHLLWAWLNASREQGRP